MVTEHVAAQVTKAMGLASVQLLNRSAGFFQLGMDSLTSVTLQRSLSESLGESLPSSVIFDYPTVTKLADYVCTCCPRWTRLPSTTTTPTQISPKTNC